MKTKQRFLFTLLMAIVMMAMSPAKMWAQFETTPLTVGTTQNITKIYPADEGFYGFGSFTLTEGGTFTATFGEEVAVIMILKGDMSGAVGQVTEHEYSGHLDAGSYILMPVVQSYTESISVTTSFVAGEAAALPELQVGEQTIDIPLATDVCNYTFTPSKAANYTFHLSKADSDTRIVVSNTKDFNSGEPSSYIVQAYRNGSDKFMSVSCDLEAKQYYVSIGEDGGGETLTDVTLTITDTSSGSGEGGETTNVLTVGPNTAHIYEFDLTNSSDPKYFFTFTPTESCQYTISFSDNDSPISVYAGFGDNADSNAASMVTTLTTPKLTAETTYNLYVDGGEDDEYESATITITKEGGSGEGGETTNTTLTVGENYVDIPANETAIFSFTPETTGWYRFHSEGENDMELNDITLNGESVISTAIGSNDYDSDYNFKQSIPLTAGSTYLLGISEYEGNAVEDYKIVVSYVTPSVLNIDDNSVTIPAYEIATYTFTPTETGSYRFHSVGDNDMEIIDITLNGESVFSTAEGTNDVDDHNYDFNFDWSIQLTKDNTYLLAIKEFDVEAAVENCNLVVSYEGGGSGEGGETPTYTALYVDENYVDIPGVFSFTPGESGIYRFRSEGNNDMEIIDITLNGVSVFSTAEGGNDIDEDDFNFDWSIQLTKDNTYLLAIKEYDDNAVEDCKIVVSYEGSGGSSSSYQAVQEGQANVNEITIPADEGGKLVEFTAPATFRFQFKTIASDYNVSLLSGVPGEEGTTCLAIDLGECQYDCTKNQTYYILLSKNIIMSADEVINLSILRVHQREMSYEWGTVCLPYPIEYDPNNGNYKLYDLTGATSSQLTFTERSAGNIYAGNPLAVKAVGDKNAETGKYTINIVASSTGMPMAGMLTVGDYTFKGIYTEMTNKTGIYFIAQNQFWWAESAITVPAYRAYLEGPAPSAGASLRIVEADGEAEGITTVSSDEVGVTIGFDLMGRPIDEGSKGLQIRDGKVIMVK